jgi:hypothetical protein
MGGVYARQQLATVVEGGQSKIDGARPTQIYE